MSQDDFVVANQGFPAFRSDLNANLQALASTSSGATAPSTTYANQLWYDTANDILKIRNEANSAWINVITLDQTNNKNSSITVPTIDSGTSTALTLKSGTTTAMTIDTSQNVGIGTSSPAYKLEVKGASGAQGYLSIHDGTGDTTVSGNNAASLLFQARDTSIRTIAEIDAVNTTTNGTGGAMVFQTRISDTLAERMRIDSSGNVGIGASSPSYGLDVGGTTNAKASIRIQNGTAGSSFLLQSDTSGIAYVQQQANAALVFATNNSERARIDSSGNIQVGTTSGSGTMNVYRSANGNTVGTFRSTSTSFDNDLLQLVCARAGATTQYLALSFYTNNYGTLQAYMRADGNWYNANSVYGSTSDARLKENIIDATPKLDSLCQLKVRNFNFISDENKTKQIGFVAQEFEEVFPSMVDQNKDGDKTIKTSVLIPMLVKAIQELKAELDALKGTK